MTDASACAIAASLVDDLPFGVVVTDASGRVEGANRTAHAILGSRLDPALVTCCALLRCADATAALGQTGCLSHIAVASGRVQPEVRVDLPGGGAVWVTAAPAADGTKALLHLRPGSSRDRRRRVEPAWTKPDRLDIRVLGRASVASSAGELGGQWLTRRPGELLRFLVAAGPKGAHAEQIAAALWPEAGAQGVGNVRFQIHKLRDQLDPGRERHHAPGFVRSERGGYVLDWRRIDLDAHRFEALVREAEIRRVAGAIEDGRRLLQQALDLYAGDFLEDLPYAEWAFAERERLRHLAGVAMETLRDDARDAGNVEEALEWARRLAQLEPLDERTHRTLIELSLRTGARGEAVRRYDALRRRLRVALGEEPSFTLSELTASREPVMTT